MKVHGTYIKEILAEEIVGRKGIFVAYVDYAVENFNLARVYHAVVASEGSSHSGHYFYDNFAEAKDEALQLLEEEYNRLEKEMEKYKDS